MGLFYGLYRIPYLYMHTKKKRVGVLSRLTVIYFAQQQPNYRAKTRPLLLALSGPQIRCKQGTESRSARISTLDRMSFSILTYR